jgi:hypothetical protein
MNPRYGIVEVHDPKKQHSKAIVDFQTGGIWFFRDIHDIRKLIPHVNHAKWGTNILPLKYRVQALRGYIDLSNEIYFKDVCESIFPSLEDLGL